MTREWARPAPPQPTNGTNTCHCGTPTQHNLCNNCTAKVEEYAANIPDLLTELDTTITRQDRVTRPTNPTAKRPAPGDINSTNPATAAAALATNNPYNRAASTAKRNLRLATWRAAIAAGHPTLRGTDADQWTRQVAWWLTRNAERLALHDQAGELAQAFFKAHQRAMQAIDTTPEHVMLGTCDCGQRILAPTDTEHVTCKACGTAHAAADLLQARNQQATNYTGSIGALITLAHLYGTKVSRNTITSRIRRGTLQPVSERDGVAQYRLADIINQGA